MSLDIRHINCVIVLCGFFSVFIGQNFYVPLIRAGMRDTCMNPDVEFTVFKIVFFEILIIELFTRL